MSYPPEPWALRGQMVVLLWRVSVEIMIERLPRGLTPLIRRGHTVVATAWVDYQPGGVLSYHELLVAVPVLHGGRPGVCITDIWVDSPASLAGGRALWGIPKELAEFPSFDGRSFSLRAPTSENSRDGDNSSSETCGDDEPAAAPIARAHWTPGRRLPGRWPSRYSTVQLLDGRLARTRVRSHSAVQLGAATMTVDPAGPLGYLAGLSPLRALALPDFVIVFGG